MLLTGHKTRAIFDRYNIINEQELLEAGDQLVAYLAQHAQATPATRGSTRRAASPAAPPPHAPPNPFASCGPARRGVTASLRRPDRHAFDRGRTPPVGRPRIASRPQVRAGPRSCHASPCS